MKNLALAAAFVMLAGCGGGGVGAFPAPPTALPIHTASCSSVALPSNTIAVSSADPATPSVESFTTSGSLVASLKGPNTRLGVPYGLQYGPDGLLYVVNEIPSAILEFAAGANGDCPPVRTIEGPDTGLDTASPPSSYVIGPRGSAFDAAGNLYISNMFTNAIVVFAPGASGDAKPIRTIQGSATGLSAPRQIAFDAFGHLYSANRSANTVTAYAPGASGNVAPAWTIGGSNTGVVEPWGVAFNSDGSLWVADAAPTNTIEVFKSFNGNVTPVRTVASPFLSDPYGEVFDSAGDLYVANADNNTVDVFNDAAHSQDTTPSRVISGLSAPTFVTFRP